MANRAYLYCSDHARDEEWDEIDLANSDDYCDSRHNIPVAWFFFFSESDMLPPYAYRKDLFLNMLSGKSWHKKFRADKQQAFQRFQDRLPLLLSLIGDAYDTTVIQNLLKTLAAFPGAYLLMDPTEVFLGMGYSAEQNFVQCRHILNTLNAPDPSLSELADALKKYCAVRDYRDPWDFDINVVGAWYIHT